MPRTAAAPVEWVRRNLLSSPLNVALTLLGLWISIAAIKGIAGWAIFHATWTGADGSACAHEGGACWPFVAAKFGQFMYGRYPDVERWRVNLTYALAAVGLLALVSPRVPGKFWSALYLVAIFPVVAFLLLYGGAFGLPVVTTDLWGGLLVTLVVASAGIAGAFPLGILLALGRRSHMPVVRLLSIAFIEFVRGVPLITVLFMASVMLPLFLPQGIDIDKLLRALIMVALFSAAYLAEVIRGGLQAIPRGQFEAADALGLNYAQKMGLIVLPQALKLVIPGIVNTFIGLFKDTSLVLIIGIFDLLGIVQLGLSDSKWLSPSTPMTGYVFAGVIFWLFCFGISRYSQSVERRLGDGRDSAQRIWQ
ncbi:MAG TPA: amino acid ABC transporter permease [Hyphomicrobiaceae bacterium]|nr:amino acid ABC transporter permease [Hyphomicrobiaceae bacterium]